MSDEKVVEKPFSPGLAGVVGGDVGERARKQPSGIGISFCCRHACKADERSGR